MVRPNLASPFGLYTGSLLPVSRRSQAHAERVGRSGPPKKVHHPPTTAGQKTRSASWCRSGDIALPQHPSLADLTYRATVPYRGTDTFVSGRTGRRGCARTPQRKPTGNCSPRASCMRGVRNPRWSSSKRIRVLREVLRFCSFTVLLSAHGCGRSVSYPTSLRKADMRLPSVFAGMARATGATAPDRRG